MFSSNRILALNVGASKIALAEFAIQGGNTPKLVNYGLADMAPLAEGATSNSEVLVTTIRALMKSHGMRQAPLLITLSGQVVFPRFVKLPAVAKDKLLQMVQYEVEQNVPFPLDEIVWHYQFIGDDSSGEQNVMIVAAKLDSVREVTDSIVAAGFEPEIIDVAPMAIYNALRFNHAALVGCTMVLDIGARSTNLIFVEDERIYSRCIPVAGNAITQELAKSLQISVEAAEQVKRERGYVSLGGVHQSEDETNEHVSRVVRNVMTRLHAEISRSINFYRSQQGGAAPIRLILTGGTSLLPHLDLFFKEKLQVEVEYLNPFVNIGIAPRINREQIGVDAFMLAEVVGLALRRSLACPVEVNLMPPELVKQKTLKKRLPFLFLAAVGVLMSLGSWTLYQSNMTTLYESQREQVETELNSKQADQEKLNTARNAKDLVETKTKAMKGLLMSRSEWQRRIDAVRKSMLEGMWLMEVKTIKNEGGVVEGLHLQGRGWVDAMRQIEEKAKMRGLRISAVEELCDRLKEQAIFGEHTEAKIIGSKEIEAYLTEFTIEVRQGVVAGAKGVVK
ncbi:MAG: type IV pilus assembly protein PilM [bacterium]